MREITFIMIMCASIAGTVGWALWKMDTDRMENGEKYCKAKYGINAVYKYPDCFLKTP